MNRVMSITKMHLRNKMNWFYLPWIILFASFFVNLVIAQSINNQPIYSGGVASIYVYILSMGAITLHYTFSFSIGFSVRRKDYFSGTLVTAILVCLISSVGLTLFSFIESALNQTAGFKLYFFHIPYFNEGNVLVQWWVIFTLLLNLYYLGFVISSVHRKFGKYGMTLLVILTLMVGSIFSAVCTYFQWWGVIFTKIISYTAFQWSWVFTLLTVIYIFVSYLLLRKATN